MGVSRNKKDNGIKDKINNKGEKVSLWKIPHLILIVPKQYYYYYYYYYDY